MTRPSESSQPPASSRQPDPAPVSPTDGSASSPSGGGAAEDGGGGQTVPLEDSEILDIEILGPEVGPTAHELGLELPDDSDEAQALLLRELSESRQEAGEHLEMLQRVAADFDNFRRRVERDQAENVERASQRVIEGLLPTLDAFDAATAFQPQSPAEEKIREGVLSTRSQLLETLSREGFEPIPATGEVFDPKVHEAVSGPGEGNGDLVVDAELRRGYVMRGRVIRPSLVTVKHA
jgi:molecular chaperone GrpE